MQLAADYMAPRNNTGCKYAHAGMTDAEGTGSGGLLPWPPGTKSATKSLGSTSLVLTELFSLSIASPENGTAFLPSGSPEPLSLLAINKNAPDQNSSNATD